MLKRKALSAVSAPAAVLCAFGALCMPAAADASSMAPADTEAPVTTLVNIKMGVEVEMVTGNVPASTELIISDKSSKRDDELMTLDIELINNKEPIQPDGIAKLRIPLPENLLTRKELYVYRIEDEGNYTYLDSTVKDGIISFDSDSFRTFVVSARKLAKDGSPETGIGLAVAPAVFAGSLVVVALKKRKR